jgi:hypothetical protein
MDRIYFDLRILVEMAVSGRTPMARVTMLVIAVTLMFVRGIEAQAATGSSQEVKPLPAQWNPLAIITGYHSLVNRKAGLAIRVLEADGSASVADNPVSLFVVATNGGPRILSNISGEYLWASTTSRRSTHRSVA